MNPNNTRESQLPSRWYLVEAHTSVSICSAGGHSIFIRRHNNLNRLANLRHARHITELHNAWLARQGEPAPPAAGSP
ncbi:MAG: hypothetical protein WD063_02880 [Pirellulales bacterium]